MWLALALSLLTTAAMAQGNMPIVQCSVYPGYQVAGIQVIIKTGDANTVTLALSGDTTDFALDSTHPPANVIVGTNGISPANCGTTQSVTVTATQP